MPDSSTYANVLLLLALVTAASTNGYCPSTRSAVRTIANSIRAEPPRQTRRPDLKGKGPAIPPKKVFLESVALSELDTPGASCSYTRVSPMRVNTSGQFVRGSLEYRRKVATRPQFSVARGAATAPQRRERAHQSPAPSISVDASVCSSAAQPQSRTALKHFRSLLQDQQSQGLHLDELWSSYTVLETNGWGEELKVDELRQLGSCLTGLVLNKPGEKGEASIRRAKVQADRLRSIYDKIQDCDNQPLGERIRWCFQTHISSLSGHIREAASAIKHVMSFQSFKYSIRSLEAFAQFAAACRRHKTPEFIVPIVVADWLWISKHILRKDRQERNHDHRIVTSILRNEIFTSITMIDSPSSFLSEWKTSHNSVELRSAAKLLLTSFVERELLMKAFEVYAFMLREDFPIPVPIHLHLLNRLIDTEDYERANGLYASLLSGGGASVTGTPEYHLASLRLFACQGDVDRVEEIYEDMAKKGWVGRREKQLVMHASAIRGHPEHVLRLFDELFSQPQSLKERPTASHFSKIIQAFVVCRDLNNANLWLTKMRKEYDLQPTMAIFNMMLQGFAASGEYNGVRAVLKHISDAGFSCDIVSYTTLLTMFARRGDVISAEKILRKAIDSGIQPDRRFFTAMMYAYVEAGCWKEVIRVYDFLQNTQSESPLEIQIYNNLLRAYVLVGAPFSTTISVFGRIVELGVKYNIQTYSIIIQSACDAGRMDVALQIFKEMDTVTTASHLRLYVDVYALTIVMSGFLRLGDRVRAREIYDEMMNRGVQPTSVTFSAILRAYAQEGTDESLRLAEEFLTSLIEDESTRSRWLGSRRKPSGSIEDIYLPLLSVYTRKVDTKAVVGHFRNMLRFGGEPTITSLTTLMDTYRRVGDIEAVEQVWTQIFNLATTSSNFDSSDIDPTSHPRSTLCIPLSIYIDALSITGHHDLIPQVWQSVKAAGFGFDVHNWNHLVVALVYAGEVERAFEVMETVIIPYQEQYAQTPEPRSVPPTSASLVLTSAVDDPNAPILSPVFRHRRHDRAHIPDAEAPDIDQVLNDLALPLYVLHQFSPSWNEWRPHKLSLRILHGALRRLSKGRNVTPVYTLNGTVPRIEGGGMDHARDSEFAYARLDRIREKYPRAVRVVRESQTIN